MQEEFEGTMEKKNSILLFRLIVMILVCSQLLLSGCVSFPKGALEGRFLNTEKYLLAEHGDPDKMNPRDLNDLCVVYSAQKNYDKLFACLDSMQKKIDQGAHEIKSGIGAGQTLVDLNLRLYDLRSEAFLELGRFDEAIKDAQKGIDDLEKYKALYRSIIFLPPFRYVLGMAYARSNQPDKARVYANYPGLGSDLLRLVKSQQQEIDAMQKCNWHEFSSKIYSAIGDYELALDEANEFFGCNLPRMRKLSDPGVKLIRTLFTRGMSNEHFEIRLYFLLGRTNIDAGNIDMAKMNFDQILSKEQITQNREFYWIILFERGRISEMEGKSAEAVRYYTKAVDVIEETRMTLNIEANKIGYAGDKQKVYSSTVSLLFREGKYQEALEYVERGKARALVDMLASKKTLSGGKIDHEKLTTLIKELDEAEMKSISLAYQAASEGKTTDVRSLTLVKKAEIAQTSKEFASLVTIKPTSIKDIQTLLSPEETLVEYYYHGDTLFAFIVTQGSVKGVKLDSHGLNNDVIAFRKNILDTLDQTRSITIKDVNPDKVADKSSAFRSLRDSGRSLYEKIFKPLEPMITTKNVTIVPHGALHYVPFNALITDKGYLLDAYSIRILPSASVLQFLQTKRGGQIGELIAFGNPDLNDPKLDLPFAQSETLAITKDNPKAKVLLRKQASKTAVKKFSDQFRYVHFACHGIFNPDKPLDSGLMLSSDDQNNGMLTVNELYDMRLNADLVTLSACETALGKVSNGDDVVGFTRGFLYAGANSIVSSLWKVGDEATSILMQEFYKNLKDRDKRTALRLAQLKVKDTYNSHPFFWAAFQLTGSIQ
jgi:CHAT domain-containing protein